MHSTTGSDHSSRSPETKLFNAKFPDLHVSEEDSVKSWCYQFECQLFEAEHLADEDSRLMPTDVSAIVHSSQQNAFRVIEFRQTAWKSDGAGVVETRRDLVVQALMRTLVVEDIAKVVEAALLCTKVSGNVRALSGLPRKKKCGGARSRDRGSFDRVV
jgi:RNase P/RNase MRP subunit POP5